MRDRIPIDKSQIPYSFNVTLANMTFTFEIMYNTKAKLFTATLKVNETVMVYNEPIIYGMPLFKDVYESGNFPALDIVPLDESGQETEVTFENFGVTVFLTIDNEKAAEETDEEKQEKEGEENEEQ